MARDNDGRDKTVRCSFCGKSQDEVEKLIAGPGVCICDECIEVGRAGGGAGAPGAGGSCGRPAPPTFGGCAKSCPGARGHPRRETVIEIYEAFL